MRKRPSTHASTVKQDLSRGGALLLATLAAFAFVSVLVGISAGAPDGDKGCAFQRATGGVGLGSTVSVAWSFFGFDPRLEAACENELTPLPGLACPNPGHGRALADLPPLYPVRAPEVD